MARININVGTNANDGTGDDLRAAMQKINTNFAELYGTTAEANDLIEDGSPQLGGNLDLQNYIITTTATNGNITLSPNGTGNLILGVLRVNGTTISSDDSSKITLAESVDVTGTLSAATIHVNLLQSDDSTAIQINDSVNMSGTLHVRDLIVNEISSDDSTAVEIKDKLQVNGTLSAPFIATNVIFSNDSSEIQFEDSISTAGTVSATSILTNTISSADSSAVQIVDNVNIAGILNVAGLQFPTSDGTNGQFLQTNGAGILTWATVGGGGGGSILTVVGDDSSGTVIYNDRTFKFAGGTNISTAVSDDTLTITGSKDINVNSISSGDSTAIQINDAVNVSGTLSADVLDVNEIRSVDSTAVQINDSLDVSGTITTNTLKTDNNATISGTLTANTIVTNDISSTDSTAIQINDGLNVSGTLSSNIFVTNEISSSDSSAVTIIDNVTITGDLAVANIATSTISSADSSALTVNDGLNVSGTLSADILDVNEISSSDSTAIQINDAVNIKGSLDMAGNKIKNLDEPASDQDAATKLYVDNKVIAAGAGTVVSITAGTGLTGGTISTTGTIALDFSTVVARVVGDDSTGTDFSVGETIKIAGTAGLSTAVSGDTVTITGPNLSSYAQKSDTAITIVGDDSSGSNITIGETFKIAGTSNITTAVSGDTLTITGPNLSSYLTNSTITIVGDDSTGTTLNTGETIKVTGADGITATMSGDTLTISGASIGAGGGGGFTVIGDDSTGTLINPGESFKIFGSTGLTSVVTQDLVTIAIDSTVTTLTDTQTLTNKTLTAPVLGGIATSASGNIVLQPFSNILEIRGNGSTVGQIQLNCPVNSHGQKIASQPHAQAASNTLTLPGGTTIGDSDAVLLSDTGTQTITNKTINLSNNTLSGTTAQFNTALSDDNFATLTGTEALTNKTINAANNTLSNIPNSALVNSTMNFFDATSTSIPLALGNSMQFAGGNNISALIAGNTLTISLSKNIDVNEISSGDSSAIQINDAVNISGTLNAKTIVTNDLISEDSTAINILDGMNVSGTLSADVLDVNEISSSDSTAIQINDAVNISGTLTVNTVVANTISAPSSTTGTYTISSPTTITLSPASEVLNTAAFTLYSRTVSQLSSLTASIGAMVYCTNETGGAVPVFFDGTNWRRVTDRAIAS